jgi:hypothetical protein
MVSERIDQRTHFRQDLEFASVIVQKLNLILITSTEMADFRRRLKNLQTFVSCKMSINSTR